MNASSNELDLRCGSCGASPGFVGTNEIIVCQFCGSKNPRPVPEAAVLAEIAEPTEPEWKTRIREEILSLKQGLSRQVGFLLMCIFFILIPGLVIAIGGAVSLGVNRQIVPAILCGVVGAAIALTGVISIVIKGMAINRIKQQIAEKQRKL